MTLNLWSVAAVIALPDGVVIEDSADVPALILQGAPQYAVIRRFGDGDPFDSIAPDEWDDEFDPTAVGWDGQLADGVQADRLRSALVVARDFIAHHPAVSGEWPIRA